MHFSISGNKGGLYSDICMITMEQKTKNSGWDERLFKAVNDNIYVPEIFKTLRLRMLYPGKDRQPPKTVMIASVVPDEGKSFVTANLGISLAQGMDQHSLLVDCDLRQPTLASLFGLEFTSGLVDYLSEKGDISDLIEKTSINKLSLLASGKPPQNPAELLSSGRMKRLVDELADRYDDRIIIFDTPPASVASESLVLAQQVDAIVLVVREGSARREDIQKVVSVLGSEKIIGIVFNGQTTNFLEKPLMYYAKGYYANKPVS